MFLRIFADLQKIRGRNRSISPCWSCRRWCLLSSHYVIVCIKSSGLRGDPEFKSTNMDSVESRGWLAKVLVEVSGRDYNRRADASQTQRWLNVQNPLTVVFSREDR